MTETLTQPQVPPREDDDEPCGLTKGQIRGLCEPRLPEVFLIQNHALYSLLVGAINAREQELQNALLGQETLVKMCSVLGVTKGDIDQRCNETLKRLHDELAKAKEHLACDRKRSDLKLELQRATDLVQSVSTALGLRGTFGAGILFSAPELRALFDIATAIVSLCRMENLCFFCPDYDSSGHKKNCPIVAYEALPKHGGVGTYKMKKPWGSTRTCRAFQVRTQIEISTGSIFLTAYESDWVITPPEHSLQPVIMTDRAFREIFELVP